jgi:hypothetical protein
MSAAQDVEESVPANVKALVPVLSCHAGVKPVAGELGGFMVQPADVIVLAAPVALVVNAKFISLAWEAEPAPVTEKLPEVLVAVAVVAPSKVLKVPFTTEALVLMIELVNPEAAV